jgi:predicted kinase
MIIKKVKGCLYCIFDNINNIYLNLVPSNYIKNQKDRDGNEYHITIINSNELSKFDYEPRNVDINILDLGLCKLVKDNNEIYYLLVYSNDLNNIRKELNLEPKVFHITLGFRFNDIHDKEKGLNNLFLKNQNLNENEVIEYINDEILVEYIKNNYYFPKLLIKQLKLNINKNKNNINELIENNNYLGYIFKYQLTKDKIDLENAIQYYDYTINRLYDKNNIGTNNCIKILNQLIMENNLVYRKKMFYFCDIDKKIKEHSMPRNFSWVINNKIGGISKIDSIEDIKVLETLNIYKIYYFLEKRYFDHIDSRSININYIHCHNTMPPKFEDMLDVLKNETFEKPILFGCLGGFGRTGTALACYLCYFGLDNNKMSSEQSIKYLRVVRPKSIESDVQLDFIKQFSNKLYKDAIGNNPNKIKTNISFIMLVGLPGAGKSTFCELFMTNNMNIKIINQDVMGRKICESSLLKFIKDSDITILDRVNYTKKDRKEWLENCRLDPKKILCIYLNTPKFICIQRVKNRENHPTIKKGGGERIIEDISKKLEEPTLDEGYSEIIKLEDEEDVRNYLKSWKCNKIELENDDTNYIHKFPRTQHIFNIGGATVDDRILNKDDYDMFMNEDNVFIAEKVDGAQMGFSIDENYKVLVQNRSHYVNSKSHSQFEKLDKWLFDHNQDLYEILDQDTILFGEWLYAKHSIEYTNLPDYFLAFDLYNKKKKLFYNRKILEEKLKNTNIHYVREMYNGKIKDKNQLLKMIDQKSEYTEGKVEGIYLKIFEDDYVKSRCKLVRNDFICGNEHWTKGGIQKNIVKS